MSKMRTATIEAVGELIGLTQYLTGLPTYYTFKHMNGGDEVFLVIGAGKDIDETRHYVHVCKLGIETAYPVQAVTMPLFFTVECPDGFVQTPYGNHTYRLLPDPIVMKMVAQFSTLNPNYMRYQYLRMHRAK